MALNLDKLIGAYRFKIETKSLGILLVHNLTMSALSALGREFANFLDADSNEFARALAKQISQKDTNGLGEYTDERISEEESRQISDDELEEFSRSFLEKNAHLRHDPSKKKPRRKKNGKSEEVTTISYENKENTELTPGESYRDLLKRLIHEDRLHQEEQTKKLFESLMPKNLFSSSVLGLIEENRKLSDRLGSSVAHYEHIKLPEIPENPVYETNRQLASIADEFSQTALLVKNMNDLGLTMALEMASASKTSKRHNTLMIVIALATLVFTAVISYLSYTSSNESSIAIEELLKKSNEYQSLSLEHQEQQSGELLERFREHENSLSKIKGQHERLTEEVILLKKELSGMLESKGSNNGITKSSTGRAKKAARR